MRSARDVYIDLQLQQIVQQLLLQPYQQPRHVPVSSPARALSSYAQSVKDGLSQSGIGRFYSVTDGEDGSFVITENELNPPQRSAQTQFKTLQQYIHNHVAVLKQAAPPVAQWQFYPLPKVEQGVSETKRQEQQEKQNFFILRLFYNSLSKPQANHIEASLRVKLNLTTAEETDMGSTVTTFTASIPDIIVSLPDEEYPYDLVSLLRLFPNRDGTRESPMTRRPFQLADIKPNRVGLEMIRTRYQFVKDITAFVNTVKAKADSLQKMDFALLSTDHLTLLLSNLSRGICDSYTSKQERESLQKNIVRVIQYKDEHPPQKWKHEQASDFFNALLLFATHERMDILKHAWQKHKLDNLKEWWNKNPAIWKLAFTEADFERAGQSPAEIIGVATSPAVPTASAVPPVDPVISAALERIDSVLKGTGVSIALKEQQYKVYFPNALALIGKYPRANIIYGFLCTRELIESQRAESNRVILEKEPLEAILKDKAELDRFIDQLAALKEPEERKQSAPAKKSAEPVVEQANLLELNKKLTAVGIHITVSASSSGETIYRLQPLEQGKTVDSIPGLGLQLLLNKLVSPMPGSGVTNCILDKAGLAAFLADPKKQGNFIEKLQERAQSDKKAEGYQESLALEKLAILNKSLRKYSASIFENQASDSSLPKPHMRLFFEKESAFINAFIAVLKEHKVIPADQLHNTNYNRSTSQVIGFYHYFSNELFDQFMAQDLDIPRLIAAQMEKEQPTADHKAQPVRLQPTTSPVGTAPAMGAPAMTTTELIQKLNKALKFDPSQSIEIKAEGSVGAPIYKVYFPDPMTGGFAAKVLDLLRDNGFITLSATKQISYVLKKPLFESLLDQEQCAALILAIAQLKQEKDTKAAPLPAAGVIQSVASPVRDRVLEAAGVPAPVPAASSPSSAAQDPVENFKAVLQHLGNTDPMHEAAQRFISAWQNEFNASTTDSTKRSFLTTTLQEAWALLPTPTVEAIGKLKARLKDSAMPGNPNVGAQLISALIGLISAAVVCLTMAGVIAVTGGTAAVLCGVSGTTSLLGCAAFFYHRRPTGLAKATADLVAQGNTCCKR